MIRTVCTCRAGTPRSRSCECIGPHRTVLVRPGRRLRGRGPRRPAAGGAPGAALPRAAAASRVSTCVGEDSGSSAKAALRRPRRSRAGAERAAPAALLMELGGRLCLPNALAKRAWSRRLSGPTRFSGGYQMPRHTVTPSWPLSGNIPGMKCVRSGSSTTLTNAARDRGPYRWTTISTQSSRSRPVTPTTGGHTGLSAGRSTSEGSASPRRFSPELGRSVAGRLRRAKEEPWPTRPLWRRRLSAGQPARVKDPT